MKKEKKQMILISALSTLFNCDLAHVDDTIVSWRDLEQINYYDLQRDILILDDNFMLTTKQFTKLYELSSLMNFHIILKSDLDES